DVLRPADQTEPEPELECTKQSILAIDASLRKSLLESYLRQLVARISRQAVDAMTSSHSLACMGMDSLMVVELQQRLSCHLEVRLSIADLLEVDISGVADSVLKQIEESSGVAGPGRMVAGERPSVLPLSLSQEQIWLWQQLSPEGFAYNELAVIELAGE